MSELWNLRPANAADTPFILSSWLHGYRKASVTSGISNTIYFKSQEALLKRLLGVAHVVVACSKDDPDQIFGYAAYETDGVNLVVHWVYVKQPFRALGMARSLLAVVRDTPHYVEWHSSRTRPSALLGPTSAYNPYMIWRHS